MPRISALSSLTSGSVVSGDLLPIVDVTVGTTGTTKKITAQELRTALFAGFSTNDTITNATWAGILPYAGLPTGSGTWDTGAGTTITIARSLTVSGTLTGTLTGHASLDLPLTGGTLTGSLLFSPDNTLDIGTSSDTRPRTGYFGTSLVVGTSISTMFSATYPLWIRAGSGVSFTTADALPIVARNGIPSITFRRTATSVDTPTQSPANSAHGDLVWEATDDVGGFQQLAFIRGASLNAAITTTNSAGWFDLRATPSGSTTPSRVMGVFGSGGVVIGGDITGSNDPGFGKGTIYIERDTGSATVTPSRVILGARTSASDWDVSNPWGKIDWHCTDTTGPGAGIRGQVGVGMATTAGSSAWMHIALSTTGANADNGSGTYNRVASFWGNSQNVRIGSTLTDPGMSAGSLYVEGNETVVGTLGVTGVATFSNQVTSTLGTITTDIRNFSGTATWNASGTTFTGILLNITNTASAAASNLLKLQVGGVSRFSVSKAGTAVFQPDDSAGSGGNTAYQYIDYWTGNGEFPGGVVFGNFSSNSLTYHTAIANTTGTANASTYLIYHNGTQFYEALKISNVAGGGATRGTLALMKSGGTVAIGASATTNVTISGTLAVTGNFSINTNKFTVTASNGDTVVAGYLTVGGPAVVKNYTVATLPAAATYQYGFAFVTDATQTAITGLGLAPTGGGANIVPVYSDGTNWLIL